MTVYDYHPYINEWMRMVEKREVYTSKWIKLLMPLVRKELDNPENIFIPEYVEEFVRIAETYYFKLMPDQKFYASLILSLFNKKTMIPVFFQIFIMAGRGWGKNGFISVLSNFLIDEAHGIKNYNVDIVATSEEQAMTSFLEVYNMIEGLGEKGKRIYDYNKTKIRDRKTNSVIKYNTSNPKTKDGGRPGCVIFDEIHAYENYENIKVFTGGLGKVQWPRRIYITTDGNIRDGVLDDFKTRSERILTGQAEHRGFLPIIMKLDNKTEAGKFELWEKANPRINYDNTLKHEIESEYWEMQEIEALKDAFMTKRMNVPYVQKTKTICKWEDLVACCKIPEIDYTGMNCVGSVDFADLRDFASAGLRFKKNGIQYYIDHSWVHESSLELTNYNIDLKEAVEKGWLTVVKKSEAPTIPPSVIAEWFLEQAEKGYNIQKINVDSFRYGPLKETFENYGLPEVNLVRSGAISHNKVAPLIDQLLATHKLKLPNTKLFRWYVWNTERVVDKKGNVTYKKIEPEKRKTDGFFCLLHNFIDDDLEEDFEIELPEVVIY